MENKQRGKMTPAERAKQFMPFSALKGLDEALRMKERILVEKRELSEERTEEIDAVLKAINRGALVKIVFFSDGEYISAEGAVTQFEPIVGKITVVKTEIAFEDIFSIELLDKHS